MFFLIVFNEWGVGSGSGTVGVGGREVCGFFLFVSSGHFLHKFGGELYS